MDLQRQVVTSRKNGKVIATVEDYYDRFVHDMGAKYKKTSFTRDKLCICPFHDDNDASLGLFKDKHDKEVKIFHCFGCGAGGDIVQFHRRLVNITEHRSISVDTASKEVANLYGIEINEEAIEEHLKSLLFERELEVERNLGQYNFRSHSSNLMKLRMAQEDMELGDFSENLDVVINMWKLAIRQAENKDN
ncbi:CHC2 zinc finger domain-containing protein [Bacillus toyonensis]|uniref:CHC2 zinc finger domain-containing protein n=1 Tax=Bacillus toyonensis TaxID=155322 RepID=UPI000BF47FF4|nr:CHC2 zinc finger domain-containing protein [Bacillus toyonensis]PGF05157.1 DNA primase [Bacillus toyonensis]